MPVARGTGDDQSRLNPSTQTLDSKSAAATCKSSHNDPLRLYGDLRHSVAAFVSPFLLWIDHSA